MATGKILKVSGPLVIAEGMRDANMFDVVRVSDKRLIGEIIEIIEYYKNNTLKGEIVAILYKDENQEEIDILSKIKKLKALNLKDKEIASVISVLYDINKNQVYKKCIEN